MQKGRWQEAGFDVQHLLCRMFLFADLVQYPGEVTVQYSLIGISMMNQPRLVAWWLKHLIFYGKMDQPTIEIISGLCGLSKSLREGPARWDHFTLYTQTSPRIFWPWSTIIYQYQSLLTLIKHYCIDHYQPSLTATIHHYSPLQTIINHYKPLSTIISSLLPTIINHYCGNG